MNIIAPSLLLTQICSSSDPQEEVITVDILKDFWNKLHFFMRNIYLNITANMVRKPDYI